MLKLYVEAHEPTAEVDLTPYLEEDGEPTSELQMARSDAIWAAQEHARVGNVEAEATWLLMAVHL